MNCYKFDLYLTDEMDEKAFHKHRENCPECTRAYDGDKSVMDRAAILNKELEVPDLWADIQRQLVLSPKKKYKKRLNPQIFAWSAAAAVLIAISFWALSLIQPEASDSRILSLHALEQVKEAEESYISAIEDLEDMALEKLDETKEPLAQLYRNKIKLIDAQINSCRNQLERNPANAHIRKYLLAALQDKQNTLTEIIEIKVSERKLI